jgi:hypothetical protein
LLSRLLSFSVALCNSGVIAPEVGELARLARAAA